MASGGSWAAARSSVIPQRRGGCKRVSAFPLSGRGGFSLRQACTSHRRSLIMATVTGQTPLNLARVEMAKAAGPAIPWPVCSLLLFVATPTEEDALAEQAAKLGLDFQKDPALTKHFRESGLRDDAWALGTIGAETVVAVGCSRMKGKAVMGPHGRLGGPQQLGDVLVSASLVPYDKRDVRPSDKEPGYVNDYSALEVEPARPALVERCLREKERTKFDFAVHVGALLSGAARVHCAKFRNELYATAPHGNDPIVGGEMEGVGLLAAAVRADDPAWCVVKGISDFADEQRDEDIKTGLTVAPRNAAYFVLSSLVHDAKMLAEPEES